VKVTWHQIEQAISLARSVGAEASCTKVAGLTITIKGENLTVTDNAGRVLDKVRFDLETGKIIEHIEIAATPPPESASGQRT
jgi:hypothetical protein